MSCLTLREWRKRRDWTQEQLAALSGIDQTTISRLETESDPNPTDITKERLAKALGIRPVQLRFSPPEPAAIGTCDSDRAGHRGMSR